MTDRIARLRARVAQLAPEERTAFRRKVESAGIPWDRVAPEAPPAARPARLPLSPGQMQFWLSDQVHPGSPAFVIAFAWDIAGPLDTDALGRALAAVAERHEPLRTRFPSAGGEPWQETGPAQLPLEIAAYPDDMPAEERDFTGRGFDLAAGPVWRVRLLSDGAARHTLLVAFHHIIADGWSRGVFLRELAAAYRTARAGDDPARMAPAPGFGDLVMEQARWLEGAEAGASKAFWQDDLAGLSPQRLSPREAEGDRRAGTVTHRMDPALTARADALARSLGVSRFVLMLALFQLYLHRLTGNDDVAVGTPVAGRERPGAEPLIGLFLNTLVLRNRVVAGQSLAEWVGRVNAGFARAFAHRDYPFARVVESSGAARQSDAAPLFRALFQLQSGYGAQNSDAPDLGDPQLRVTQRVLPLPEAKFDLSWHMLESGGALSVIVEYREALFGAGRVRAMLAEFETLLAAAAASPEAAVETLDFVPVAAVERGPDAVILDLVTELSERGADTGEGLVCLSSGTRLSHAGLWAASGKLARRLRARPELTFHDSRIAISLTRGPGLVVAILAALRAGIPYVPLDPAHPAARRNGILADADVALMLSDRPCDALCPVLDPATLGDTGPKADLPLPDPDRLAYLIFTSGSTGRPKGVPVTHRSLSNLVASMAARPGMSAGDRLLAVTTVAFDIAALELLLPLFSGGTLVLAGPEVATDPARLAGVFDAERITHMQATPATWRMVVDAGWSGRPGLTAMCGGEALKPDLARALMPKTGALWNMYGPTETTIWSGAVEVTPDHLDGAALPVGGPVANTTLRVLDRYGTALPDGVAGELAIGGAGLSPGYWRLPDLTAQSFVTVKGDRLYRTGDRVEHLPSGGFRFLGRLDHQIKLNGLRIEPGEVEAALTDQPGVAEAVVMVRGGRLVAWVRGTALQDLRTRLTERLPAYMVPARIAVLDAFPLNSNGKIDRARLPEPEAAQAGGREPESDAERLLHDIWSDVLRRDRIGVEENFFDAGGASVSAMQIASRAREAGLNLTPAQMFEHQTIAAQAAVATPAAMPGLLPPSPYQAALLRRPARGEWRVSLPLPLGTDLAGRSEAVLAAHPGLGVLPGEKGWQVGESPHPWSVTQAGDRMILRADAALLDAPSVARLATELLGPSGRSGPASGHDASWPKAASVAARPPEPLAGDGTGGAAGPLSGTLEGAALRALRTGAEQGDAALSEVIAATLLRVLVQWRRHPVSLLLISDADRPGLGNFTAAHALHLRPEEAPGGLAAVTAQRKDAIQQDPDALPPGLAVLLWRDLPDPAIRWESVPTPALPPDPALSLTATATPDRITLNWDHDPARLRPATLARLSARLISELATMPADPADKLARLKTRRRTGKGSVR